MVYVLTVDQIRSRQSADRVETALHALAQVPVEVEFTRTIGDELQGVLNDPVSVVTAILILMRDEHWHIGVGLGPVQRPLPADSRVARGPAFVAAREAVGRAKSEVSHLAVSRPTDSGADDRDRQDAETMLRLLTDLVRRRTDSGWAAVDLIEAGSTQEAAAGRLGVTRQAVNQRLLAARHQLERDARATAARLLDRAERATG